MGEPSVFIVSDNADSLGLQTAKLLQARAIWVEVIDPYALADCRVTISDDFFYVNDRLVGGVLFRTSPDSAFSAGFVAEDQAYSDSEVRAIWLAALNSQSVLGINRYDAVAWFEGSRWTLWRRRLMAAGIEVAEFTFGDSGNGWWYPYCSVIPQEDLDSLTCRVLGGARVRDEVYRSNLMVCDHIMPECPDTHLRQAFRILREHGISVAEIMSDSASRIIAVNTQPDISNPECLNIAAQLIATAYETHFTAR